MSRRILLPVPRPLSYFRFYAFALLVNWTGHVQRLSVSLQFIYSVYRDVLLLKIAKIGFYTGELSSSVSAPNTVALQLTQDDVEAAKKEWENMVFLDDE